MSKGTKIFAIVGGIVVVIAAIVSFGGFLDKPTAQTTQQRGIPAGQ